MNPSRRNPWFWIPTLYLAEGLPYTVVLTISIIMYKGLGIANHDIAFYTSWLYIPWVLKPLWSPMVDTLATRRTWVWATQLVIGAGLAGLAFALQLPIAFRASLIFLWILAVCSATHDIAADGYYMLATNEKEQAFFVGIRITFYRIAMISGQGLLVILAGFIQSRTGNTALAWTITFATLAILFIGFGGYHRWIFPAPALDQPGASGSLKVFFAEFAATFADFFRKPKIIVLLLFLLFYRFAEAQLVRMVSPFLLDARTVGGLGLTTAQVGLIYGTLGLIALTCGGILGGMLVSKKSLSYWLWPMALVMHIPDAVFVYLAYAQPTKLWIIGGCIAAEQFGYGFGFAAYMLYMIYIARGRHQTAHYAICTGFMALSMMIPGLWSGRLQETLGYPHYFLWVLLATLPGFAVVALIPLERDYGKKYVPTS